MTALPQHLDALHEIADGALERDHGVARRKIGEAPVHRRDFGAHRAEVDRRGARLGALAAHVVELAAEGANVIEQQLRELRRGVGFDGARRRIRAGFCFWTGVQGAWIALTPGLRRRAVAKSARLRFRSRGGGPAGAGLELVAAHGDLRHGGHEIEWRLGVRRGSLSGTIAARPAGLGGAGQARPDRFEPPHRVDQRAAVAVPRRVVPLQDLRDRFKGARGLGFGAREPHFEALDHRIEGARHSGRARLFYGGVSSRDAFETSESRVEPIVGGIVLVGPRAQVQSRVVGDHVVEPILQAHAGAAGGLHSGVAGPPAYARDIPRHGSIHVLDHRSGAGIAPGIGGDVAPQFCRRSW